MSVGQRKIEPDGRCGVQHQTYILQVLRKLCLSCKVAVDHLPSLGVHLSRIGRTPLKHFERRYAINAKGFGKHKAFCEGCSIQTKDKITDELHFCRVATGPDKKHALWVDTRDGKGVLLSYSLDNKKDDTIQAQSGLVAPDQFSHGLNDRP